VAGKIRFYLDEHVPRAVATGLRMRGIDVLTAQEAGLLEAPDADHLTLAMRQGRMVFTQDADFLRMHAAGAQHAGIAYASQQTPVGGIVRGLMLIHQILQPREVENHVEFL